MAWRVSGDESKNHPSVLSPNTPFPRAIFFSLAAAAVLAGCASVSVPARPHGAPVKPPAGLRELTVRTPMVKHWGSFFGGSPGNRGTRLSPVPLTLPGKVVAVGSSNSTQYALLANGHLYAWGLGTQGQLGDGRLRNSLAVPVRVRFPAGVKIAWLPDDAMPYDSGLAVDTDGRVWGWGRNRGGEFCLGRAKSYATPVRLPFRHVTAVAGASNHAIYDADGTVWACGQNVAGDLGTGRRASTTRPQRVAGLAGAEVTRLVASFANSGALLSDGEYFNWGYNADGQLGDGHAGHSSAVPVRVRLPHPVTFVAQGGSLWHNGQTLVILTDGSLWSWGDNQAGALGTGTTQSQDTPVQFRSPPGVRFVRLATGSKTSYAISSAGRVWAWGVSHVGQVGNGRPRTMLNPVVIARRATSISSTANNVAISLGARPASCPAGQKPGQEKTKNRRHKSHKQKSRTHRHGTARAQRAC
jgi:alpha-tubulin suppressor-like RCC1 family protein